MSDDTERLGTCQTGKHRPSTWHAETPAQRRRAIELCSLCPLLEACREYALNEMPLAHYYTETSSGKRLVKVVVGGVTERQIWHYREKGVMTAAFQGHRRPRQEQNASV